MIDLSDTPAGHISRLDASLAKHGSTIVIHRRIGESDAFTTVTCRAKVRNYRVEELVGGISQGDMEFTMSPSMIVAADPAVWPGAAGGSMWPNDDDSFVFQGRFRQVVLAGLVDINDVVVRIKGRMVGG